jgi:hypothetical protein
VVGCFDHGDKALGFRNGWVTISFWLNTLVHEINGLLVNKRAPYKLNEMNVPRYSVSNLEAHGCVWVGSSAASIYWGQRNAAVLPWRLQPFSPSFGRPRHTWEYNTLGFLSTSLRPDRFCYPPSFLSSGSRSCFPGSRTVGSCSWPLISISFRGQECVELYFHSPNTSSWRGAELKHGS